MKYILKTKFNATIRVSNQGVYAMTGDRINVYASPRCYVYDVNRKFSINYTHFPVDKQQIYDTNDARNMKECCLVWMISASDLANIISMGVSTHAEF